MMHLDVEISFHKVLLYNIVNNNNNNNNGKDITQPLII